MATSAASSTAKVVNLHAGRLTHGQMSLLPLRVDVAMSSDFGSADLKKLVMTHDRHYYAVKLQSDHPLLPASEFICYKLAAACNLSVPFSSFIEMPNQEIGFGSRFEGGLSEWNLLSPSERFGVYQESSKLISGILAFDLFVGNEDRHMGNFVWRKNHDERWVPFAIDYSRAFLVRGFPHDDFPVPISSHTRSTIAARKKADSWEGPYAVFTLEQLHNVQVEHIAHWFNEMPISWVPIDDKNKFLEWWGSSARLDRLNAIFELL